MTAMRTIGAVVVALVLSLLAACSSGAHAEPPAKSATAVYLHTVRDVFHATNHRGDAQMIRYGHYVCSAFPSGGTWAQQIVATTSGSGLTRQQAGRLITAATIAFCPKYAGRLPQQRD